MTTEHNIAKELPIVPNEPPRIQGYYETYKEKGSEALHPAGLKMILHLLPGEERNNYEIGLRQQDMEFWNRHMDFRRTGYEAVIGKISDFRQRVSALVSAKPGDTVIDLGAGVGAMAPYFDGTDYYAVEVVPSAKEPAEKLLGGLVSSGKLASAQYLVHNLLTGFPAQLKELPVNQRKLAVSVMSAAYFPADRLIQLIKDSFSSGCEAFYYVALKDGFNPEKILKEMEETRVPLILKTPGGPEAVEKARAAYDGMRAFGREVELNLPIRSRSETEFYLNNAGRVTKYSDLGTGTMGFEVLPR